MTWSKQLSPWPRPRLRSPQPKKAVEWYREAAEQGHAGAQFNLGVCYANGEGMSKDVGQAVVAEGR